MIRETQNLEMLVTVARLLSSKLDISDLLATIMRLATRVVNSERASLYLLDEKTNELYFHVALDLDEEVKKIRLKLGEGIAGTCAKDGKSIITNDIESDQRHTKKVDEKSGYITKSLLTCPMIIKGKVIGVVQAINKIDGEFDEVDKINFEAFASQAAIAIENSRLFNSVKYEKSKLETLLEMIDECIIVTDNNGNIRMNNRASLKYFGVENLKNHDIKDLFSNFKLEKSVEEVISFRKSNEFLIERNEPKKLILKCNFIPKVFTYEGQNEEEFIWIFSDVTREIMESRISREFLSLISHKLKTPLTSIIGFAQVLKNVENISDERLKKAIESISSCGFKLNNLVDKMLNYSLIENKTPADLAISEFDVDEFISYVISSAKKNYPDVNFEKDIIDLFKIKADRDFLEIALNEIISNSVKFNSKQNKKIIITSKLDAGKRLLLIWDNGNGIPSEEIDKIFDKFYQVEDSFTGQVEGMGLGLAMVKTIMKLHNFDIKIKSKPGNYTLVSIHIDKV